MNIFDNIKKPEVLYETTSDFNGKVEVVKLGENIYLKADGITQSLNYSSEHISARVWGRLIDLLKEVEGNVLDSILILGLGGATMQHLIANKFPNTNIVSVEIDPVIVDIAKKYFELDSIPNHEIIVDDACRVILDPPMYGLAPYSFRVIIVDIFCGDKYPELGNSGNFFAHLKRLAMPQGLVIFNRFYKQHQQEEVDAFIENVSEFFGDADSITIPGKTNADNILIYART